MTLAESVDVAQPDRDASHAVSEIERNEVSAVLDQHDGLRFPCFGIASHAWGVRRHAWQCNPDRVGAFIEEPQNGPSRYVTFDHIALEQRGVA